MKNIKKYILMGAVILSTASCSDFLDTFPKDSLSPATTWKNATDADKFLIGCYDGWADPWTLLYWDCASDFGYNNFPWEGLQPIGNGSLSASSVGWDLYNFATIYRCNDFLANVDRCEFNDENERANMKAQARVIRAYQYFVMNWNYGGVPLIDRYTSAAEAQMPRASEADVRTFIEKELDECTKDLSVAPAARGRIGQGAALAIRMREALYYGDWATAKDRAQKIMDLNLYELTPFFENLFNVAGQKSPEIIAALQYIDGTYDFGLPGQMYNNGDGGWSSIVPTQHLIDAFEMANGLTIDEAGSGYDATHPYNNRDPRMSPCGSLEKPWGKNNIMEQNL